MIFPGFNEASGNLDLQPFARIDHVEAKVVPVLCGTNSSQLRLHLLKHWTMSQMVESATEGLRYEPVQPGSGRGGGFRRRAAGAGAALLALLLKAKSLLLLLPKLKLLATF